MGSVEFILRWLLPLYPMVQLCPLHLSSRENQCRMKWPEQLITLIQTVGLPTVPVAGLNGAFTMRSLNISLICYQLLRHGDTAHC